MDVMHFRIRESIEFACVLMAQRQKSIGLFLSNTSDAGKGIWSHRLVSRAGWRGVRGPASCPSPVSPTTVRLRYTDVYGTQAGGS